MVKNRIKVMRAEADISATALAEKLPDVQSKVAMSFIEQGRVPDERQPEQMRLLGCTPTTCTGSETWICFRSEEVI